MADSLRGSLDEKKVFHRRSEFRKSANPSVSSRHVKRLRDLTDLPHFTMCMYEAKGCDGDCIACSPF